MARRDLFSSLGEANVHLNAIIEHSFDGIFITDGKANVLRINSAYESITGLKKEDVLGKNMTDLVKRKVISDSGSLIVIRKKNTRYSASTVSHRKRSLGHQLAYF